MYDTARKGLKPSQVALGPGRRAWPTPSTARPRGQARPGLAVKLEQRAYHHVADPRVYQLCDLVCGQMAQRFASQAQMLRPATLVSRSKR
jgi:hypothetical protein